ncbi:MAG: protoporphyrinogen oxidase [Sandaracinaceae bacterium]
MPVQRDAVVVGGGIAGLACARRLLEAGVDVELLEAGSRVGGSLASRRVGGHVVDLGPQTVLGKDPELFQELSDLGLDDALLVADRRGAKRYIVLDGRPVALPGGPLGLLSTRSLSLSGKLRLLGEPFAPRGEGDDESVDRFMRRRLGAEVADRVVDPFVSGVHAGDPTTLSMRAAFPGLLEGERTHGSLLRWGLTGGPKRAGGEAASRHRAEAGRGRSGGRPTPRPRSRLFSFAAGLAAWPRALAGALGPDRVRVDARVERLARSGPGAWTLTTRDRTLRAPRVVLAVPAPAAADLLADVSAEGADALRGIRYAPVTTVHLTYPRDAVAHPLDGFGMLFPSGERAPVLGVLWVSSLFAGRASPGTVQTATFVGGARSPDRAALPDDELVELVHGEHRRVLGASGDPGLRVVARWPHAIPRLDLGHPARLDVLRRVEQELDGLRLAGSYAGTSPSVAACWARGRAAAERIVEGREDAPAAPGDTRRDAA